MGKGVELSLLFKGKKRGVTIRGAIRDNTAKDKSCWQQQGVQSVVSIESVFEVANEAES